MYSKLPMDIITKAFIFIVIISLVAVGIAVADSSGEDDTGEVVVTTTTQAPTTTTEPEPTTTAPPTTEAYIPPAPPTTQAYIPPPPPPPAPVVPEVAAGSIEEMICNTFGDQCQKALSVVRCESSFNAGTVGAAGERGLFQIHPVHIPYLQDRGMTWDSMFDPASNIAYAYDLYSRSGWGPWTCA